MTANGANIDLIRRWYAALGRQDQAACRSILAPESEWSISPGFPHGGIYRGADAVLEFFFARLLDAFESIRAEVDRLVAEGDTIVSLGTYAFRLHGSGGDRRTPFAHVIQLRDGRIVAFRQIVDGTAFLP